MRRLLLGLSMLALLPVAAPPATAANRDVTIVDNAFQPDDVTIGVGDTVTWRNTGDRPHSVQADDGQFNSSPGCSFENTAPCMRKGSTFSFTATRAGTIFYHCAVHGSARGVGMAGSITVASSSTSSTAPATTTTTSRATTTTRPATTTTRAQGATTTAAGGAPVSRPPDEPLPTTTVDPDAATSTTIPLAPATTLAAPAGDDDDDGPPLFIIVSLLLLAAALAAAAFAYRPRRRL